MDQPVACNLNVLDAAERDRRLGLVRRLAAAVAGVRELPSGYEISFEASDGVARELDDLVEFERRCCTFLTFDVTKNEGPTILLAVTGPEGTKQVLEAELGGLFTPRAAPGDGL